MRELTNIEQLVEAVNQLATIVRNYYDALKQRGFSDKDALQLSIAYQNAIINLSKSNN